MRLTVKAASDRWPEDDAPCVIELNESSLDSPWLKRHLFEDARADFDESEQALKTRLEAKRLINRDGLVPKEKLGDLTKELIRQPVREVTDGKLL